MLTSLDIENKKFSKKIMNGYDSEEVDDFLDELGVEFAKKQKELTEAFKEIEDLKASLEHYKNIEETLQNTLLMAQSTAEEVKNVAKQKADQIIEDARASSTKEVASLDNQIIMKKKELEDVTKQFDIYKAKMESLLISQLELIKEINKNEDAI
ncbi:MAG TPA: septum formation initiator [Clostridiales bacterium]|nr:septum formation initiator [Clostridiales bacterium]